MIHPYTQAMKTRFAQTGRPQSEFETFLEEQRAGKQRDIVTPDPNQDQKKYTIYKDTSGLIWERKPGTSHPIVSTLPANRFDEDGVYLLSINDCLVFYRCKKVGDQIQLTLDLEPEFSRLVSIGWFNQNVRAEAVYVTWKHG